VVDQAGAFFTNGAFGLAGSLAGAGIRVESGAQITIGNPDSNNSFVVMQAPRIEVQEDTQIEVNGSLAMVAAESATYRLRAGCSTLPCPLAAAWPMP
jgi:hypothetical protein